MITETSLNENFLTEFIDDLYAEYDERLGLVRRDLLALEAFINQPNLDKSRLDALLRHLHTLKGLSGTINLKAAEQLAHQLENYLRALRQEQAHLSPEGMEALIAGVRILEQVMVAHQTQSPLPDTAPVLTALTTITTGTPPPSPPIVVQANITPPPNLTEHEQERFKQAIAENIPLWLFKFEPTPVLAGRGINVNTVRQRLEAMGILIQAKPLLPTAGTGLAFEFIVATKNDATHFALWQLEGISYQPYAPSLPTTSSPPPSETAPAPSAKPVASLPLITHSLVPSNVVRVDLARIDELMRMLGELVNGRARQENHVKQLKTILPVSQWRALQETNLMLERSLRNLREGIMRVRMVPIGNVLERMKFVIRDLMSDTSKQVKLELRGQDTEIDKLVVDQMLDPLLHLVRNAVSHGIETPAERLAQGKPAQGKILLHAYTAGEAVVIEVEDDGCGINLATVTAQAQRLGLVSPEATLAPGDLLDLLCKPGFSTQTNADLTSGRGVGMDVVKTTVTNLGGFITLDTQAGKGTRFTIQLPLTLAIIDALIVAINGQRFAIPQLSLREVIELDHTTVTVLENNEIIPHRGNVLVLIHLGRLFGLQKEWTKDRGYVLVVSGSSGVGLVVDRLLDEQEIVVQALNDPLVQVPGISGATELGDGKVVLILDVAALTKVEKETEFMRKV